MKLFFTLLLATALFNSATAQNYQTGKRTITYVDPIRLLREIPTDVYYPAAVAGTDVPLAPGNARFPVVVFGHGFLIGTDSYQRLADSLVKYGYIVAFPTTEGGILPSHDDFGKDLSFVSLALSSSNFIPGNFFFLRINPRVAIGGHSMGGGCSFLAASATNPFLQAVFNFAAAETNPSATAAASSVNKPSLIFSGSNDCIVPPATQLGMYNNVTALCKTYVNITDATHCQFSSNNFACTLGQIVTGCNGSSINVNILYNKVSSILIPFLDFYLKDDCNRGVDYLFALNALTGATKLNTCASFPSCGVVPVSLLQFTGSYNGKEVPLLWNTAAEIDFKHFVVEKSADGSRFEPMATVASRGSANTAANYQFTDAYPYPGFSYYRLKIVNADGGFTYSAIVKVKTARKNISLTRFYPNPVQEQANLEMYAEKNQQVVLSILSMQGQKIQQHAVALRAGVNLVDLYVAKLAPGAYFLHFYDQEEQAYQTIKFVKQ